MSAASSHPTILIADDHEGMRRVIRQVCQGLTGMFIESGSGAETIAAFIEHSPDWVIIDLSAPVKEGFDSARAILETSPSTRIILISQLTEPDLRNQALQAGAVEFVGKDELSRLVDVIGKTPLTG